MFRHFKLNPAIIILVLLNTTYFTGFAQETLQSPEPLRTDTFPVNDFDARDINSDGPMQTIGISTMRRGFAQVELSAMYSQLNTTTSAITGQALVRLGISSWLEARLMLQEGSQRLKFFDQAPQSIFPFSTGFKAKILEARLRRPGIAFVGQLQLPVNSHIKENSTYWSPLLRLCIKENLSSKFNLQMNVGFMQQAFSRNTGWTSSVMTTYQHNSKFRFFAEYFGRYSEKTLPTHAIDLGILYQNGSNYQIHLSAGSSVLKTGAISFVNAGFSFRLPG